MVPPPTHKRVEKHRQETEEYEISVPEPKGEKYVRLVATATVLAIGLGAVVAENVAGSVL